MESTGSQVKSGALFLIKIIASANWQAMHLVTQLALAG